MRDMRDVQGFPLGGGGEQVAESRAAAATDEESRVRGRLVRQGGVMRVA